MKPVLTSLLLFMFYLSTAQIPLDSFYRDGARWVCFKDVTIYDKYKPIGTGSNAEEYQIFGDTVINSNRYKKVYIRLLGSISSTTPTSPKYIGRLRISGRKVYYTNDSTQICNIMPTGKEKLMYDFGLNVGDTFNYLEDTINSTYTRYILTDIDSIQITSGQYIRKYSFSGYNGGRTYYEGLGLSIGFFDACQVGWGYSSNASYTTGCICFQSGSINYKTNQRSQLLNWYLQDNCYDINLLNTTEPALPRKLTVFPNPVSNTINLKGSIAGKEAKVALYNSMGQIVYCTLKEIVNNNLQTTLKIPALAHGIYNLIVTTEKTSSTTRILVE